MLSSKSLRMAAIVCTLIPGACAGDERVESLQPGMPRDSAIALLTGTPVDSVETPFADGLANVWRSTPYLTDGQRVEIIFYSRSGEVRTATDTVPDDGVVPVVIIDGKLIGYGPSALRSVYERYPSLPKNKY